MKKICLTIKRYGIKLVNDRLNIHLLIILRTSSTFRSLLTQQWILFQDIFYFTIVPFCMYPEFRMTLYYNKDQKWEDDDDKEEEA